MPAIHRKQLRKAPETLDEYLSAMPQWFEALVDYTDVQAATTAKEITLWTLPKKTFIHAVHWKGSGWNSSWAGAGESLNVQIGDQDDSDRWLAAWIIHNGGGGAGGAFEEGIGLTPWCGDFTNTHDLEVLFTIGKPGSHLLSGLTAGTLSLWFLLSSADL